MSQKYPVVRVKFGDTLVFKRKCLQCGYLFDIGSRDNDVVLCSEECKKKRRYFSDYFKRQAVFKERYKKVNIPKKCSVCGEEFLGWETQKTCSFECRTFFVREYLATPRPKTEKIIMRNRINSVLNSWKMTLFAKYRRGEIAKLPCLKTSSFLEEFGLSDISELEEILDNGGW